MFFLILLALEATVLLEAYLAWKDGYLFMSQAQALPHQVGMKVSVFIEHAGMWGDFFIISPLLALIISRYFNDWYHDQMVWSLVVGFILASIALITWSKSSVNLDGEFARNGVITVPGWFHFFYTGITLTVILLYYFASPVRVPLNEVTCVTLGLMVHVVLGVILPDLNTNGRVSAISYLTVGVVWSLLLVGLVRLIW